MGLGTGLAGNGGIGSIPIGDLPATVAQTNQPNTFTQPQTAPLLDKGGAVFNPLAFGAKGDGRLLTDGAMDGTTAALTCATSTPFAAGDVGKKIVVAGAGAAGASLVTTISAFTSSSVVTLAAVSQTVVAAANVGFGTDDTAAVQSLVKAGCMVELPFGSTFFVSQLKFDTLHDVGIRGGGTLLGWDDTTQVLFFRICQRVDINGIRIGHAAKSTRVNSAAIQTNNGTDVRVRGCEVFASAGVGISINACWRAAVTGNSVHDTIADGITIHGGSAAGGLQDGGSLSVAVTGNVLNNCGDDSISVNSLQSDAAVCRDIAIVGNSIYNDTGARGIDVTGGQRVLIGGNEIDTTVSCGIYIAQEPNYRGVSDVLVKDNLVSNASTTHGVAGILVKGVDGANPVSDVSVIGNKVTNAGFIGIQAWGTVAGAVGTVRVSGNHVCTTGVQLASAATGIEFDHVALAIATDNWVELASGTGILFDANCTTAISDRNQIYNPNQESVASRYGVRNLAASGFTSAYVVPDGSKTALTATVSGFAIDANNAFTGNGTVVVPLGVTRARVKLIGGGGGGGGGGSALLNALQAGGAGGGAGGSTETIISVTPGNTLTVTIGGGGNGGGGGAANSNAGSAGAAGTGTTIADGATVLAAISGGASGLGSAANSAANVSGGVPGRSGGGQTGALVPGVGGNSGSASGGPLGGAIGGGGGGPATATLGGGGGNVASGLTTVSATAGTSGASATAAGVVGASGNANTGSGGGGGGGGSGGNGGAQGAGGNGGTGGSGYAEIRFIYSS